MPEESSAAPETRMPVDVQGWSFLWGSHKHEFVLLQVREECDPPLAGCLICDLRTRGTLLIEDSELALALMSKMREAGVPIVRNAGLPAEEAPNEQVMKAYTEGLITKEEANRRLKEYGTMLAERDRMMRESSV
jgi:hypothetical protein